MYSQFGARFAAVCSARGRQLCSYFRHCAALAGLAASITGCMPATVPIVARDPADPSAKIAVVDYRSTIAPYSSLRPTAPAPWRERNDSVAPPSAPER